MSSKVSKSSSGAVREHSRTLVHCIVMLSLLAILYFAGAASIHTNTASTAQATVTEGANRS